MDQPIDPKLTLGDAAERVNGVVDAYSKERVRLEDNFTKLLLPGTIALAALLVKDAFKPGLWYYALYVTLFFGAYAAFLLWDLYAAERALVTAIKAQDAVYKHMGVSPAAMATDVLSEPETKTYVRMEATVGHARYVMPSGKLLLAVLIAAIIELFIWLLK